MTDGSANDSADATSDDLALEPAVSGGADRRRVLWSVLAVVAVVTGTVVVASSGDGGPPLLPVGLGASSAREGAASMASDMVYANITYVAGDELPALGGKAPAYKLRGDVGRAQVRRLADALGLSGEIVREGSLWRVRDGDASLEVAEDNGGSWWFASSDGGVSVSVGGSGGGSVGCDPDATECAVAEDSSTVTTVPDSSCAADGPGCQQFSEECPPNAKCALGEPLVPAEDLPTKPAARQIALDLLAATGVDVAAANVSVDGPFEAWYIGVEPRLDGVLVSGMAASVSVGPKGTILHASGTLGTPERLGDYPLIDSRAAVDRLNETQGGFGDGPVPLGAPDDVARDYGAAVEPAPEPAYPCDTSEPGCLELLDPVQPTSTVVATPCKAQPDGREICEVPPDVGYAQPPDCVVDLMAPSTGVIDGAVGDEVADDDVATTPAPDPLGQGTSCGWSEYPQPEPQEIVLTGGEGILTMLFAFDGSGDLYLVPGYRFTSDDGAVVEVPAITDESLAAVTPEATGSTNAQPHTEPQRQPLLLELEPGQEPEIGVGYYVDVNTHCGWLAFADRWWATDESTPLRGWAEPTEGGTFTLTSPDEGVFVGDYEGTKTANFTAKGPLSDQPLCD